MKSLQSRREFLVTSSLAAASTALSGSSLQGQAIPPSTYRRSCSAEAILPPSIQPEYLRTLALTAIDAARGAGASYADVRVAERHSLQLEVPQWSKTQFGTEMRSTFAYGLRVIVEGTWAFVHGTVPSADDIALAARRAVASAREYSSLTTQRVELLSTPVATGEWETPIQIDPFSVPLRDQVALIGAWASAAERVHRGGVGEIRFAWTRETRTFASSEGSLTTQLLRRCDPSMIVVGDWGMGYGFLALPEVGPRSGGYETVAIVGLQDRIKSVTEDAVRMAALPRRSVDVGRYPVVFDGRSLASVVGRTIGPALELDRVVGNEADAYGSSYLSPPGELLGKPIANPMLTITAHRTLPSVTAVRWDDEGVSPREFPVVTEGRLENYHSSRNTACALRPADNMAEHAVTPSGCAVAPEAGDPVLVRAPHLTVAPSSSPAALEHLCRDMTRGLVVMGAQYFITDQQFASGALHNALLLEVERGKIVRRVQGNGLQFSTGPFWKSLTAVGDQTTVRNSVFQMEKGQPWQKASYSANAPAGLFKEVNVVAVTQRI